jgi:hypothetical protein
MKRFAAVAGTVFALTLFAFTTVSGEAKPPGVIRLCGGPSPGGCFTQEGTVTVLDAKGHLVASERTRHARFSFLLQPGNYTLQASTGGTRGRTSVLARAHRTTTARILIAIP